MRCGYALSSWCEAIYSVIGLEFVLVSVLPLYELDFFSLCIFCFFMDWMLKGGSNHNLIGREIFFLDMI